MSLFLLGVERASAFDGSSPRGARGSCHRGGRRELETPATGKDASDARTRVAVVPDHIFIFPRRWSVAFFRRAALRERRVFRNEALKKRLLRAVVGERVRYPAHGPPELGGARVRNSLRAVEKHQRGGRGGVSGSGPGDDGEPAGRVRSAAEKTVFGVSRRNRVRGVVRVPARGGARDAHGPREVPRLDRTRVQDDRASDGPRERAKGRFFYAGTDDGDNLATLFVFLFSSQRRGDVGDARFARRLRAEKHQPRRRSLGRRVDAADHRFRDVVDVLLAKRLVVQEKRKVEPFVFFARRRLGERAFRLETLKTADWIVTEQNRALRDERFRRARPGRHHAHGGVAVVQQETIRSDGRRRERRLFRDIFLYRDVIRRFVVKKVVVAVSRPPSRQDERGGERERRVPGVSPAVEPDDQRGEGARVVPR